MYKYIYEYHMNYSVCILQVIDRLFSSFGQDTLDSLFWTAAEPKGRKREHIGLLPHLGLSVIYVCILLPDCFRLKQCM